MDAEFDSASALQLSVDLGFSLNITYCNWSRSEKFSKVKCLLVFFRVLV